MVSSLTIPAKIVIFCERVVHCDLGTLEQAWRKVCQSEGLFFELIGGIKITIMRAVLILRLAGKIILSPGKMCLMDCFANSSASVL